jgi:hypothetical protein
VTKKGTSIISDECPLNVGATDLNRPKARSNVGFVHARPRNHSPRCSRVWVFFSVASRSAPSGVEGVALGGRPLLRGRVSRARCHARTAAAQVGTGLGPRARRSGRPHSLGSDSSKSKRTQPRGIICRMVRPDESTVRRGDDSCCTELAGGSPAAVSAGAPRSRPRAIGETLASEWGVESPRGVVRLHGGEQVRRPSDERTLQPRDISTRKVGLAEPLMSRRRQQTASARISGGMQDARGVWEEGMRIQFGVEQERLVPAAHVGRWRPL